MEQQRKNKLYKKLWENNGERLQLGMIAEECGVLAAAANRVARGRYTGKDERFVEELADVLIVIEQAIQHYDLEKWVDYLKKIKLEKLEVLVK
jgi:NTP pyrophosphatase (non-canonical NTP hydrolase)